MYEILDKVNCPEDLKKLDECEIPKLNEEIRRFLVTNVSKTGGHLASNLGVVELSVALHRVFDTPKDRIIFDVGHQSYVHKLLTGRKDAFPTLRRENGISGFTKRSESEYDCFGAGHSSTSISAALGFAEADKLCGRDNYTIAVVGDGAFTGGMIYEALNNCRESARLIIILNENEMSISKNVGNLAHHISKVRATKGYFRFKRSVSRVFDALPLIGQPLKNAVSYVKYRIKGAVYNLNFFENLGLKYLGPIDGNDYYAVETMLNEAKKRKESILLHIKTVKGCGYGKAVQNPEQYHGISPKKSKAAQGCDGGEGFSAAMGGCLCALAENDPRICAITAAMSYGTGLDCFEKRFPARCFDVGIAEAHAVTFFAGLSAAGMKPVFAVYSTFLQRAYDSILHDVALQKLGGLFLIDRAGFAPEDGATHHGIYDAAFLSQVQNLVLYEPLSAKTLCAMMKKALKSDGFYAIRYPKGTENPAILNAFFGESAEAGAETETETETKTEDEKADVFPPLFYGLCEDGRFPENVVITYGRITAEALGAAEVLKEKGIPLGIAALQTLHPVSSGAQEIAKHLSGGTKKIAFLEEGIYEGGVAMLMHAALCECGALDGKICRIFALRGEVPEQAPLRHIYRKCGFSQEHLTEFFEEEHAG